MRGGLGDYAKYGSVGISWVLSTAVYLYIGYRGGRWLDGRFDTAPIFMVAGMVVAVAMSLMSLTKELLAIDQALRERSGSGRGHRVGDDRERKHFPESGREYSATGTRERGDGDRGQGPR